MVHHASLRGIRLVITFANYWQHYGGIDMYNMWSFQAGAGSCNGDFSCRDQFFKDPGGSPDVSLRFGGETMLTRHSNLQLRTGTTRTT